LRQGFRLGPQRLEPAPEREPRGVVAEVAGEGVDRAPVEVEAPERIAARGEQEQRAAPRRVELALVELDVAAGEERERRPRLRRRARLEAALEAREQAANVHDDYVASGRRTSPRAAVRPSTS